MLSVQDSDLLPYWRPTDIIRNASVSSYKPTRTCPHPAFLSAQWRPCPGDFAHAFAPPMPSTPTPLLPSGFSSCSTSSKRSLTAPGGSKSLLCVLLALFTSCRRHLRFLFSFTVCHSEGIKPGRGRASIHDHLLWLLPQEWLRLIWEAHPWV